MVQTVENLLAVQETQVRSPGQEDPLEEGMAAHFRWETPWAGGAWWVGYSPWGGRVNRTEATNTRKYVTTRGQ